MPAFKSISYRGALIGVLVVDDSSTMRRIVINTLARLGHQDVVEAIKEKIDAVMA